jgi:hypothetical protein
VPQKIRNILERSALHPQAASKYMSQVVPARIPDPRFNHRIVEPMASVFEEFPSLSRLKHTSFATPPVHKFQGGYRNII